MIVYGKRGTTLASEKLNATVCPHCQAEDSLHAVATGQYAHVFWIPLFPVWRSKDIICEQCEKVIPKKEIDPQLSSKAGLVWDGVRFPLWYFSGLAILFVIVSFSYINDQKTAENEKVLMATPMKGDIYRYEAEERYYTSMKIVEVNGDFIAFFNLPEMINKKSHLKGMEREGNFVEDTLWYEKQELVDLYNDKVIFAIVRE